MDKHTKLRELTAGRVQFDKTQFFSWKWMRKYGKFKLENAEHELKVRNISMNQSQVKEALRTVGAHTCPQLQWDEQHKVMKEKMIESIEKLNTIEIKQHLACLHFNTHLLKKAFSWCGVTNLKDRQDN